MCVSRWKRIRIRMSHVNTENTRVCDRFSRVSKSLDSALKICVQLQYIRLWRRAAGTLYTSCSIREAVRTGADIHYSVCIYHALAKRRPASSIAFFVRPYISRTISRFERQNTVWRSSRRPVISTTDGRVFTRSPDTETRWESKAKAVGLTWAGGNRFGPENIANGDSLCSHCKCVENATESPRSRSVQGDSKIGFRLFYHTNIRNKEKCLVYRIFFLIREYIKWFMDFIFFYKL